MIVNNGEEFSTIFRKTVFSIYIEKILRKISESKSDLNFGIIKLDVIAYADDLLLISTNKRDLQELSRYCHR